MKDKDILILVAGKRPEAFQALYEAYEQRLMETAVHYLGSQDPDCADVVQDTFLVAMKKLPRTRVKANLYGWLNRICTLHCFERLRQRRRLKSGDDAELKSLGIAQSLERHRSLEDEKERSETAERVMDAILGLKGACREILGMRVVEGKSYAEIGKEMQLPIGTVMSRLARCMQHLKEKLAKRQMREGRGRKIL